MENRRLYNAAMTIIVIAGIVLTMIYAQSLLVPILIAGFIAMLLVPLVSMLERKHFPRILAIVIALFVTLFILASLGFFFGSQISNFTEDLGGIQDRFNEISDEIEGTIDNLFGIPNALNFSNLNNQFFTFLKENAGKITGMAFSTLGRLSLLILIPVYTFMFLLYRDHFVAFVTRLFKDKPAEEVVVVITDMRKVIQHYITGMLKVIAILAVLNGTGLLILGIKHAIFFAVFAAILNVVPYIGPLVGSIVPMTFALFTKDSLWYPLGVLICFTINQSIEGHFLTPKIVGSNVNINPLTSLLALILGGTIWGIVGMILFIPMTAILKKILELSPRTEAYAYLMGEENGGRRKPGKFPKLPYRRKRP
jgi:predicted PurR-regulated permease PerM